MDNYFVDNFTVVIADLDKYWVTYVTFVTAVVIHFSWIGVGSLLPVLLLGTDVLYLDGAVTLSQDLNAGTNVFTYCSFIEHTLQHDCHFVTLHCWEHPHTGRGFPV